MHKKSGSNRIFFKTDQYEGTLYKPSPYFLGAKMWDELPLEDIELPDIFSFTKKVKIKE